MYFHDYLDKFIRRVFITDSVLSSIGGFEFMAHQNMTEHIDFQQQQQTMLNILKEYIL